MEKIKNFAEYSEAQKRLQKVMENVTVQMLMFGKPAEMQAEIDEIQKAIYDYKHSNPFEVHVRFDETGYKVTGIYASIEEAKDNCPKYDAYIKNSVTGEDIYWAEESPDRYTW